MKKFILLLAIIVFLFSASLTVGTQYVLADGDDIPIDVLPETDAL